MSKLMPYEETVVTKPSVKARDLSLNNNWTWGLFRSTQKTKWQPEPVVTIKTVEHMWYVINRTLGLNPKYMQIRRSERWLFKEKNIPDWTYLREEMKLTKIFQLSIQKLSVKSIIILILFALGETLPGGEDLIGIRIKPNQYGGQIRLWITNKSSAYIIHNFLVQEIIDPNIHFNISEL